MAYTALPTVTTGDYWTLTQMRTYLRDNWIASVPDIATAAGSIFVGTGAGAASELLVGSDYETLVADSGEATGVKWGRVSLITILLKNADQTLAGTAEDVVWQTESVDEEGLHAANSSDIDFVSNGVYLITCHLALYNNNASPTFYGELLNNGTAFAQSYWEEASSDKGYANLFAVWPFLSTDVLKVKVTGSASSTLKVLQDYSYFSILRLGDYTP